MTEPTFTIFVSCEALPAYGEQLHWGAIVSVHVQHATSGEVRERIAATKIRAKRLGAPWRWGTAGGAPPWGFVAVRHDGQVWHSVKPERVHPPRGIDTIQKWADAALESFLGQWDRLPDDAALASLEASLALKRVPLVDNDVVVEAGAAPPLTGFIANIAAQMAPIPHGSLVSHIVKAADAPEAWHDTPIALIPLITWPADDLNFPGWALTEKRIVDKLNGVSPADLERIGIEVALGEAETNSRVRIRCAMTNPTKDLGGTRVRTARVTLEPLPERTEAVGSTSPTAVPPAGGWSPSLWIEEGVSVAPASGSGIATPAPEEDQPIDEGVKQGVFFLVSRSMQPRPPDAPPQCEWSTWRCVHTASALGSDAGGSDPANGTHYGVVHGVAPSTHGRLRLEKPASTSSTGEAALNDSTPEPIGVVYRGHSVYDERADRLEREGSGSAVVTSTGSVRDASRSIVKYTHWARPLGDSPAWATQLAVAHGYEYRAVGVSPFQCGALPKSLAKSGAPWELTGDITLGEDQGHAAPVPEPHHFLRTRAVGAPVLSVRRGTKAIDANTLVPSDVVPLAQEHERIAVTRSMGQTAMFSTARGASASPSQPSSPICFERDWKFVFRHIVVVADQNGARRADLLIRMGASSYKFAIEVPATSSEQTWAPSIAGSKPLGPLQSPVHLTISRCGSEVTLELTSARTGDTLSTTLKCPTGPGEVSLELLAGGALAMDPPHGTHRPVEEEVPLVAARALLGAPVILANASVPDIRADIPTLADLRAWVRPPPVDHTSWDYRLAHAALGGHTHAAAHREHVRAGHEIGLELENRRTPLDPPCDLHLDDPAVSALVFDVVPIFARSNAKAQTADLLIHAPWREQSTVNQDPGKRWSDRALAIELLRDARVAAQSAAALTAAFAEMRAGEIWQVSVRAFVDDDECALIDGAVTNGMTKWTRGETPGRVGPASTVTLEIVTDAWRVKPSAHGRKPDDADIRAIRQMLEATAHGRAIVCDASPARPSLHGDYTWDFVAHQFAYLRQARLYRMQWRWMGRDLPRCPPALAERGMAADTALAEWKALAFAGRADDDAVYTEHVLRPLDDIKLHTEPNHDDRSRFFRFRLTAQSRYVALFGQAPLWPHEGEENPWTDVFVPSIERDAITRPSLRALVPLTRVPDSERSRTVTSALAVLDDPWFDVAGVAEELEGEILRARWLVPAKTQGLPPRPYDAAEVGLDPIRTAKLLRAGTSLHVTGPVGYTLDAPAGAQRFAHSAFVLNLESRESVDWAFVKVSLRRLLRPEFVHGHEVNGTLVTGQNTFALTDDTPRYIDFDSDGSAEVSIGRLEMTEGSSASSGPLANGPWRAIIQRATPARSGPTVPTAWAVRVENRGTRETIWAASGVIPRKLPTGDPAAQPERPTLTLNCSGRVSSIKDKAGTQPTDLEKNERKAAVSSLLPYLLSEPTPPLWCQLTTASNVHHCVSPGAERDTFPDKSVLVGTDELDVRSAGDKWQCYLRGESKRIKLVPAALPEPDAKLLVELWVLITRVVVDARGHDLEEYCGLWNAFSEVDENGSTTPKVPNGDWTWIHGKTVDALAGTRLRFRILEVERRRPAPQPVDPTKPPRLTGWKLLWPAAPAGAPDDKPEHGREVDAEARIVRVSDPSDRIRTDHGGASS